MPLTIFVSTSQVLLNVTAPSNKQGALETTHLFNKCPGNAKSKQADYPMASACHTSINTSQAQVHTFNNSTMLLTHIGACFYVLHTYIIIFFLAQPRLFFSPTLTLLSFAIFLSVQESIGLSWFPCTRNATKMKNFFSNFQYQRIRMSSKTVLNYVQSSLLGVGGKTNMAPAS